jgi:hypothetical protein
LIFSIETRVTLPEERLLLSQQAGKMAMSMIAWLPEKDGAAQTQSGKPPSRANAA